MKTPNHIGNLAPTIEGLQAQIASLTAENERLRELLREVSAYFHGAIKHNILNALQPKEGEEVDGPLP